MTIMELEMLATECTVGLSMERESLSSQQVRKTTTFNDVVMSVELPTDLGDEWDSSWGKIINRYQPTFRKLNHKFMAI